MLTCSNIDTSVYKYEQTDTQTVIHRKAYGTRPHAAEYHTHVVFQTRADDWVACGWAPTTPAHQKKLKNKHISLLRWHAG